MLSLKSILPIFLLSTMVQAFINFTCDSLSVNSYPIGVCAQGPAQATRPQSYVLIQNGKSKLSPTLSLSTVVS